MIPRIQTVPIAELSSGDKLTLQIYQFIGSNPGKKAYIQANLHGAEIVGNAVISKLIEFFCSLEETQLQGEIWLVPACNPMSINQRSHHFSTGRFNAYDGENWNRIFWDYEREGENIADFAQSQLDNTIAQIQENYRRQIALYFDRLLEKINSPSSVSLSHRYRYFLQSLCLDADYVIDIHSSTNQGIDYLYCFPSQEKSAKYFLLDRGIMFDKYDGCAFDEAFLKPWIALEKHLNRLGKSVNFDLESWTLELGSGMQMNPDSVFRGVRGIKNYLVYKEMLDLPNFLLCQTFSHALKLVPKSHLKKYYAPQGGLIQSRVQLGTFVEAGQWLYQLLCLNKESKLPTIIDVCAERSGLVFDVSTNHAVNQGEYILEIMEDP
jgi:uncharacterized protein